MKDRIHVLNLDMLSMYGQDVAHLLTFVVKEMLVAPEWESFSPLSSKIPVDLDTLPIMLKVGIKSKYDLNITGHPPKSLHLDGFEAVKFSYFFIRKGLSCLSIL